MFFGDEGGGRFFFLAVIHQQEWVVAVLCVWVVGVIRETDLPRGWPWPVFVDVGHVHQIVPQSILKVLAKTALVGLADTLDVDVGG